MRNRMRKEKQHLEEMKSSFIDSMYFPLGFEPCPSHCATCPAAPRRGENEFPNCKFNRNQIAYIVYTSGTTGQPKPIKISNSNLLQFLFNYSLRFQRKNDGLTRVLQFASYSFDVSVMSIWDTLAVRLKLFSYLLVFLCP
jgi:non-ribosomal peptide synthetase component F